MYKVRQCNYDIRFKITSMRCTLLIFKMKGITPRKTRIYRAFEKYPAKMKRQRVGNLLSRKT